MQTKMISASPIPSVGSSSPFDAGPFAWAPHPLPLAAASGRGVLSRVLIAACISWVPLAILSAMEGLAFRSDPHESFFLDFGAYGRYLIATPVLVYAASAVLPRLAYVVRHFLDSELIQQADRARYDALVASSRRLLTSSWVDVAILTVALVGTIVRSET